MNGDKVVDAEFVEVVDSAGNKTRAKVQPEAPKGRFGFLRMLADDVEEIGAQVESVMDLAEQAKTEVPRIAQTAKRLFSRVADFDINDRKPMKR